MLKVAFWLNFFQDPKIVRFGHVYAKMGPPPRPRVPDPRPALVSNPGQTPLPHPHTHWTLAGVAPTPLQPASTRSGLPLLPGHPAAQRLHHRLPFAPSTASVSPARDHRRPLPGVLVVAAETSPPLPACMLAVLIGRCVQAFMCQFVCLCTLSASCL